MDIKTIVLLIVAIVLIIIAYKIATKRDFILLVITSAIALVIYLFTGWFTFSAMLGTGSFMLIFMYLEKKKQKLKNNELNGKNNN